MSLTFAESYDEIHALFKATWDGTGLFTDYEDVPAKRANDQDNWSVFRVFYESSSQASLGGTGNRMFRRRGTIIVSIYTRSGNGLQDAQSLAKTAIDIFEGNATSGGVWFRNAQMQNRGMDGEFYLTQVLVNFEYDEVK